MKGTERYEKSVEKTNVGKLLNAFEKIKNWKIIDYFDFYEISSDELNSINYSLKDIENLCPVIKGNKYKIGIYISAAINKIIKDGEEVRLNFRNKRIDFIGLYLSKGKIIVEGNAGDCVGFEMNGGNINIKGNAGNDVGIWMKNGSINVEGNAGNAVGFEMKGGNINIKGNAGSHVGIWMEGGNINIKGNAGNGVGHEMEGGSINIKRNAGDYVGFGMNDGSINIKGNVGDYVGYSSKGGEIRIDGDYKSIGENCKAKVYHKGSLLNVDFG